MKRLFKAIRGLFSRKKKGPAQPFFSVTDPIKSLPGYFFWLYDPETDGITRFQGRRHHYGGGMYAFWVPTGWSLIRARNEAGARTMLKNRAKRRTNAEKSGKTPTAA